MRGYSTSKAFGSLFNKSPKIACYFLGITTLIWGIALLSGVGTLDSNLRTISCILVVIGSLIIVGTTIYAITSSLKRKKREDALNKAIMSTGISQVDSLTPFQFEDWVARFLNLNGFTATTTKRSGDFGADVIAYRGDLKIVVSCKKYVGNLGVKCVQEIIGAMDYYEAHKGWVFSTCPHFSRQAYELAQSRGVKLFTKNDLALMLDKLQKENLTKENKQ